MVYRAPPGCPSHLIDAVERAVNSLPTAWLLPPQTGEIFDTLADCERRLRGYCLAEGSDLVQTGGGTRVAPGARFACVYHGKETRNWRKLEDHVERDGEGQITSKRQRELTLASQLQCQWSVRVTWKDIGKRGSGKKGFVMTVICLDHVHELSSYNCP
jgi:hypothetical protein